MARRRTFRRMIAKRVINVFLTIIGIMVLNFCLIHFMPGNPIDNVYPRNPKFDVSLKWALMEKFHVNDSLIEQLGWYLYNTFRGDWGVSYMQSNREVFEIIMLDLRWTLLLVGASTVFTIILGMFIGAYSAYRRGGKFDVTVTAVTLFFYGMPVFWLALILQYLFTTQPPLGISWWPNLPAGGYFDTDRFGPRLPMSFAGILSVIEYLILPSITLAFATLAGVSLVMRGALLDVMTEEYVITARAKGLTDYGVLRRHALPNGMPPMVALIAMDVAFILGGAYQVEVVFNYPGIGYRTIKAISDLDFPILQFIIVIGGIAVVIANFIADMVLIYIDPRIKIA
jgi:peptide/nickel transport system permease protein